MKVGHSFTKFNLFNQDDLIFKVLSEFLKFIIGVGGYFFKLLLFDNILRSLYFELEAG